MQFHFNKKQLIRWFYYIIGMLILAMGLTLNAESNLGSSPIISIPYTLSFLWPVSFANLTLALYVLFVMLEFILKGKTGAGPTSCRSRSVLSSLVFWTCSQHGLILQIPASLCGWLFWRLQLS